VSSGLSACVCGADKPCPIICDKHNNVGHGYPCEPCAKEWRQANPNTHAAIAKIARGHGADFAAAKRADEALRKAQP
jgi:hypothetical protein